jgi:hypothetical protein
MIDKLTKFLLGRRLSVLLLLRPALTPNPIRERERENIQWMHNEYGCKNRVHEESMSVNSGNRMSRNTQVERAWTTVVVNMHSHTTTLSSTTVVVNMHSHTTTLSSTIYRCHIQLCSRCNLLCGQADY